MPWKERTEVTMREEFVKRVLSHEKSKSELCREYGISRPTGDKWIKRYLNGENLENKSKAPFRTANKTPPEMESFLVEQRKQYPAIGAVKLRRILENSGEQNLPCTSTVNAIFKRNGLITPKASDDATPYKRFEKSFPNDLWQADFKGNFPMNNGERCHPLNVIDDCTRYNICSHPLAHENLESVVPVFTQAFKTFGLPRSLLCDNGTPWGTSQSTGFTRFEVWMMDLGILIMHGRANHPQTQGKEERYNGSMKRELLNRTQFDDWEDAMEKISAYREFYNNVRPHWALGLDVPSSRYKVSERKYPDKIEDWEYPSEYKTRRIKSTGYITVGGQGYYLSEALGDRTVAVRESSKQGCINIYYRQFILGRINVDKRVFDFKRIYLAENDPRHEGKPRTH